MFDFNLLKHIFILSHLLNFSHSFINLFSNQIYLFTLSNSFK